MLGRGPEAEAAALRETILRRLAQSPADPRQLAADTACTPERLAEAVRELLGNGKIATGKDGLLEIIP